MPVAHKGKLITCDAATKQYLLHLNESVAKQRFVIEDLDETHLLISLDPQVETYLSMKIDEWNERNTYYAPTR